MKLGKGIIVFATEEAKKKWEGKELPKKEKKKTPCPSCDLNALVKKQCVNEIEKDYINKENT
jgi:hypothetical protein